MIEDHSASAAGRKMLVMDATQSLTAASSASSSLRSPAASISCANPTRAQISSITSDPARYHIANVSTFSASSS